MDTTKTSRQRIAEARERGSFTDGDLRVFGSWESCACGEQRYKLGGNPDWEEAVKDVEDRGMDYPKHGSYARHTFGMELFHAVEANHFDQADALLDKIERLREYEFGY